MLEKIAIQAQLPLIAIQTEDTVNVDGVLEFIIGVKPVRLDAEAMVHVLEQKSAHATKKYFVIDGTETFDMKRAYTAMAYRGASLIIVNAPVTKLAFNAGQLQLPQAMLRDFLLEITVDDAVDSLMVVLGGLTLKEVGEVCKIAMSSTGELTPRSVVSARKIYSTNVKGVRQVQTTYPFYQPPHFLFDWLSVDGKIFMMKDVPEELIPRGLVFDGSAGTGKTMGAKYLANELGIPLFHLNLGSMLGKYVGESEGNLEAALSTVDQMEPCILLLDEVEKVLAQSDDSGVSGRMLASLLWWLQEHKSKVFTILTTNDLDSLPKELYRPGRIDHVFTFKGLTDAKDKFNIASGVLHSLNLQGDVESLQNEIWKMTKNSVEEVTPAEITNQVHTLVKNSLTNVK